MSRKRNIHHYLNHMALHENWLPEPSQILSFHWGNWRETSEYIRETLSSSGNDLECHERIKELEAHVDKLKEVPIWLKSRRGQLQTNLYHLYECYNDSRLRLTWFDRKEEIIVSFSNEAGPYSSVTKMLWFDKSIYACFTHFKLLKKELSQRDFRIGFNIPIEARRDGSPIDSIKGRIHQVAENGIVLHFSQCSKASQWSSGNEVSIVKCFDLKQHKWGRTAEVFRPENWLQALDDFSVKREDFKEILKVGLRGQNDKDLHLFIPLEKTTFLNTSRADGHKKGEFKCLINEAKKKIKKDMAA